MAGHLAHGTGGHLVHNAVNKHLVQEGGNCCPASITVTFAGVNASLCTSCFTWADGTFKHTSLSLDGAYTLNFQTRTALACIYSAVITISYVVTYYQGPACTIAWPFSSESTEADAYVELTHDLLTCRLLTVDDVVQVRPPGHQPDGNVALFETQTDTLVSLPLPNELTCAGNKSANGGTAILTLP